MPVVKLVPFVDDGLGEDDRELVALGHLRLAEKPIGWDAFDKLPGQDGWKARPEQISSFKKEKRGGEADCRFLGCERSLPYTYPLRAADSLQLAAALIWCRRKAAGRTFITSYGRMGEAAAHAGFSILNPRADLS